MMRRNKVQKYKNFHFYKFDRNFALFFLYFLRKYKFKVFLLTLMPALWSISESLAPYFIKLIIDNLTTQEGYLSYKTGLFAFLSIIIFMEISMRVGSFIGMQTWPLIRADIRNFIWDHLIKQSYLFFQENLVGDIASKINNIAHSFERGLSALLYGFYSVSISFLISCFLIWLILPSFSMLFFMWYLAMLGITLIFLRKSLFYSSLHAESENLLMGNVLDVFRHISLVKMFSRQNDEIIRLQKLQRQEIERSQRADRYIFYADILRGIISTILLAAMMIALMMGWKSKSLSLGDVTFISIVALTMRRDIWWSSLQILTACREFGATIDGLKLLQPHQEIVDCPDAKPCKINKGNIEFKNVSFEYPSSKEIFSNLNVKIPGGKTTAIIGFSGVGKTTFIHLILRFLESSSGSIFIDKEDIKDITHESLLQNISIIPQEPGLFHRTLLENIRYAKPNATEEEIFKAATIAHCHEFILTLDKGYETIVGEQGLKLSAGQRQRIAIARAVLKEVPIIILDEATSALDVSTESEVQRDLQAFLKEKTAIIITHKLNTLVNADQILVFDKGKIIQQGTHKKLIQANGFYKKFYKNIEV